MAKPRPEFPPAAAIRRQADAHGRLARDIRALKAEEKHVVLVSSGAIALGARKLGYRSRPKEMAKLQARTVGGTEDYVVTREFARLATEQQRIDVLRACFVVAAANGSISAEESAEVNQIANELQLDAATVNRVRSEFHELLSSVQAVRRLAEGR